jgi:hypothetical protein
MHEQQARFDLARVIDTIDVDADSLFHSSYLFHLLECRRENCAEDFLCQFEWKVNAQVGCGQRDQKKSVPILIAGTP